jgi:transcriptional regulator with XRE-family HTH domain
VSTSLQRSQILQKIRNDKEYRDSFVAEQIYSRLPLKIRNMRVTRCLKQRELAARAEVAPEWITQVENPNYGRFTLKTLLKIASALDVGLVVDFVPYSRVVNDSLLLSNASFDAPSSKDDAGLIERKAPHSEVEDIAASQSANASVIGISPNVLVFPKTANGATLGKSQAAGL